MTDLTCPTCQTVTDVPAAEWVCPQCHTRRHAMTCGTCGVAEWVREVPGATGWRCSNGHPNYSAAAQAQLRTTGPAVKILVAGLVVLGVGLLLGLVTALA